MRVRYRNIKFKDETLEIVVQANTIITQYGGVALTVRQIFYRFIGDDLLPDSWRDERRGGTKNTPGNYKRLAKILTNARYAGLVDWDLIEDRGRGAQRARDWPSATAAVEEVAASFRLDRWRGQPFYVELWCEKAALAGTLSDIAWRYHVTLMIDKGYNSASAMKVSADRIRRSCPPEAQVRPVVLYVGDHDPSGLDMVRDVRERLVEFGCPEWLDVREVALTMEQVKRYNLPPNPLKMKDGELSDSRAEAYRERHGEGSWEVDALPPDVFKKTVEDTLKAYVDQATMDAVVLEEEVVKARLRHVAAVVRGRR